MVIYYHSYEILKKNLMQIKVFKEYEQCTMCLKHAFKTNKQTKNRHGGSPLWFLHSRGRGRLTSKLVWTTESKWEMASKKGQGGRGKKTIKSLLIYKHNLQCNYIIYIKFFALETENITNLLPNTTRS